MAESNTPIVSDESPLTLERVLEIASRIEAEREQIERQLHEDKLYTRTLMLPKFIRLMHDLEWALEHLAAARIRQARVEPAWGDKQDQFSERVRASHPLVCDDADRYARYALAMEIIHSRHSKYALVDLVNWLLTKWPELQAEAKR